MTHPLLRLLLILYTILHASAHAEISSADWIKTTSVSIHTLDKAFNNFKPDNDNHGLLSDYLISLSILKGPMQSCIDSKTRELETYKIRSGTLGSGDEPQTKTTDQSFKEIERRQNNLKHELTSCSTLLLEIKTLSDTIKKMQNNILADFLFTRHPNFYKIIIENLKQTSNWSDTIQEFFKNRLQLQTFNSLNWLLLASLLITGVLLGNYLRDKLNTFAGSLKTKELSTQLSLSLCIKYARIMPYLLAASGTLAGLLLITQSSQPSPFSAPLIALICYLLLASSIAAILNPKPPAVMIVKLSPEYGLYLYQRLHTLLLLGLFALLAYVIDAPNAMTDEQWQITRSIFLLLATLNLIWLISILHRVPGILGTTLLRTLIIVILLTTAVAELIGYRNLSVYLFQGLLGSALLAMALWLANALLTDMFDGLDSGRHHWQQYLRNKLRLTKNEPVPGSLWLRLITLIAAWTVFIVSVIKLWGYNAASWSMLIQHLTLGFEVGEYRIEPVKLILAVAAFSLMITFVRWFKQETLPNWVKRTRLDRGAREAVVSISGYIGIIVAALLGLSLAGFSFTNITIIAGALSVGIGFGLQNIVNNFISGIILLFERPIRTGDWIVVGNTEGYVRKISIRSTQIETFDRADVIVPNSELISNQVTNWMLNDQWGRVIVPIGVAYGSDTEKVRDVLLKVANEHDSVLKDEKNVSPPKVLFRGFGDSSLNFELRCFLRNVDQRLVTNSDLNFAIDKAFREAGIQIPFPQRDLHVRSVSDGIQFTGHADS